MLGLYRSKTPDLHTRAAQLYDSIPLRLGGEDLVFEDGHIEISDMYIACVDGFLDAALRSDGSEMPEMICCTGELLEEMYRVCDEKGDEVTRAVLENRVEVRKNGTKPDTEACGLGVTE